MKQSRLKNQYLIDYIPYIPFKDSVIYSPDYFQIFDIPDRIYLGKSSFKLNINLDNMVLGSRIFIELLDANNDPIYYSISDKQMPDRSKLVTIEIFDTTPNGIAKLYIAGRCKRFNGVNQPHSADVEQPNLLYVHQLLVVNSEITDDEIIFQSEPSAKIELIQFPLFTTVGRRETTVDNTSSSGHTLRFNKVGPVEAVKLLETPNGSERIVTQYKHQFQLAFKDYFVNASMVGGIITISNLRSRLQADYPKYNQYILDGNPHLIPDTVDGSIISYGSDHLMVGLDFTLPINVAGYSIDAFSDFDFNLTYISDIEPAASAKEHNYVHLELSNLNLISGYCHDIEVTYKPYNTLLAYASLGRHRIHPQTIFDYYRAPDLIKEWTWSDTPVNTYIPDPASDYFSLTNLLYTKSDRIHGQPKFKLDNELSPGAITQVNSIVYYPILYKLECTIHSHSSLPFTLDFILDSNQIVTYQTIAKLSETSTLLNRVSLDKSNIETVVIYFRPTTTVSARLSIDISQTADFAPMTIENLKITPDYETGINPSIANFFIPIENFKLDVELEFNVKFLNSKGTYCDQDLQLSGIRFDSGVAASVIDKDFIGLPNVDNTSDLNKPVSTPQQTALNLKYNANNPLGFETPTQLNSRDTSNRARVNHIGSQAISTITGLQASLDSKLANTINTVSSVPSVPVNFDYNFINVTTQAEALSFPSGLFITGPNNKEITIMISDDGHTSQSISYSANWICMNGSFPATTDNKVTVIKAIKHQDGNIYCRAYQS